MQRYQEEAEQEGGDNQAIDEKDNDDEKEEIAAKKKRRRTRRRLRTTRTRRGRKKRRIEPGSTTEKLAHSQMMQTNSFPLDSPKDATKTRMRKYKWAELPSCSWTSARVFARTQYLG